MLNEGLEVLGVDEYLSGDELPGVFQHSALESVKLPSTLKRIEYNTFVSCANLKAVDFPDGLETIGLGAFRESGLQGVKFPASLRTIEQASFAKC